MAGFIAVLCRSINRTTITIGWRFHVKLDLTVPGYEIAVSRDPERDPKHQDVYVALADAFRAARRRLSEHARILRGEVKHHRVRV